MSINSEKSFFYRYALVLSNEISHESLHKYFIELLRINSFDVLEIEEKGKKILLLSQKNEKNFFKEAQFRKMKKPYMSEKATKKNKGLDVKLPQKVIENEKRRDFSFMNRDHYLPDANFDALFGDSAKKEDKRWGLGLFTESEMLNLEFNILQVIEVDSQILLNLVKSTNINLTEVDNYLKNEKSALWIFKEFNLITAAFPLHTSDFKETIFKETFFSALKVPYNKIRSYYGDKVAVYYAWVSFYTRLLIIPAVVGLILSILNSTTGKPIYLSIYSIFMVLWAQLFILFWNRKTSELTIEWDNYGEEYDRDNYNRDYKGTWRISPITEKPEKYYPDSKRKIQYLVSVLMALPLMLLGVFINVCYLNLTGYIHPEVNSFFEIPFLYNLSLPGNALDSSSAIAKVLNILQPIFIMLVNKQYRTIAYKTTVMENHKHKSNFDNSLTIKRYIFEFMDFYLSFFYIGFVLHDMEGLRKQLINIFIANEIRRLLTETIIPNTVKLVKGNLRFFSLFKGNPELCINGEKINPKDITRQLKSEEYDTFDDYLEIIVEFGFMTMFAECIPIAPLIIFIVNSIEIRSDIFKLSSVFRRPEIIRKRNIGSWDLILKIQATISIFTNLFLALQYTENEVVKGFRSTAGTNRLMSFFLFEHLVLFLVLAIWLIIPRQPAWVKLFLDRRQYKLKTNRWKLLLDKSQ